MQVNVPGKGNEVVDKVVFARQRGVRAGRATFTHRQHHSRWKLVRLLGWAPRWSHQCTASPSMVAKSASSASDKVKSDQQDTGANSEASACMHPAPPARPPRNSETGACPSLGAACMTDYSAM